MPRQSQLVFVTNPELKREYEILRASGIYLIVDETNGVSRLTLEPLACGGGCGLGAAASMFTLGIIPGKIPGRYSFQYELETNGVVEHRVHFLPVYVRLSIWEGLLRPLHGEKRIFAKALARSPALQTHGDFFESVNPADVSADQPVPATQSPKAKSNL